MYGNLNTNIRHKFHSKKDHPEMFTNSQIYKPKHIIFNISFFSTCNEDTLYIMPCSENCFQIPTITFDTFSNLFSLVNPICTWTAPRIPFIKTASQLAVRFQAGHVSQCIFKDHKKCHSNILPIIHDNQFLPYQPVFLYTKPINNSIKSIALFCQ